MVDWKKWIKLNEWMIVNLIYLFMNLLVHIYIYCGRYLHMCGYRAESERYGVLEPRAYAAVVAASIRLIYFRGPRAVWLAGSVWELIQSDATSVLPSPGDQVGAR